MTQFVGDVTRRALRSVTVQLYLKTGGPAGKRNFISHTCILSNLVKRGILVMKLYRGGAKCREMLSKNKIAAFKKTTPYPRVDLRVPRLTQQDHPDHDHPVDTQHKVRLQHKLTLKQSINQSINQFMSQSIIQSVINY